MPLPPLTDAPAAEPAHAPAAESAAGPGRQRLGRATAVVLALSLASWAFLLWLTLDMGHPLAQLTMPPSADWRAAELAAIGTMWALMMAAMMLPSALPMVRAFVQLSLRSGAADRAVAFIAAYLLVWLGFSVAAVAVQWLLQAAGWLSPMIVSTSPGLTAALLLLAGLYQFSPLKRACLAQCRSPLGFLLGEWRPGRRGAWAMGLRHGLLCLGCCWALMALLFVGGAMHLPWIAALSLGVALEKRAPHGERLAWALGVALLAVGLVRLARLLA